MVEIVLVLCFVCNSGELSSSQLVHAIQGSYEASFNRYISRKGVKREGIAPKERYDVYVGYKYIRARKEGFVKGDSKEGVGRTKCVSCEQERAKFTNTIMSWEVGRRADINEV
jgi:hypothetical protein